MQCLSQVNTTKGKHKHLGKKHLFHMISRKPLQGEERDSRCFIFARKGELRSIEQATLLNTQHGELGQLIGIPQTKLPLSPEQSQAHTHLADQPC